MYERIIELHRQGHAPSDIAKLTGKDEGEVRAIIVDTWAYEKRHGKPKQQW